MGLRHLVMVALAACGGGGGFPDAKPIDAVPATGTFTLDWALTDTNNQPILCDPVGGQTVTVLAHNLAVEGGVTEVFTCSTGMGMSQGLPPGTYDFDFELDGAAGVLSTSPTQRNLAIVSGANTQLAAITFSLDATGNLALTMASGKANGNCGGAPGGAGITATTITLARISDSACEAVTLAISAGATKPAGNYTINCGAPAIGPCIESDQTLSVMGIAADNYMIHIVGNVGATACWSNNDALDVPPLGNTLTRTMNLQDATGTPGC